jgi:xylulokinase
VQAISGAAAQHSIVFLNSEYSSVSSSLSSSKSLKDQLSGVFASPYAPNWQDSTTTKQCRDMEAAIGGTQSDKEPSVVMANVAGSSAHERFSGPQLKKVYQQKKDVFDQTDRVCVLSAFLTTLLCADGEVKAVDEVWATTPSVLS